MIREDLAERGFRFIFYPNNQKGPSGSDAVGWTDRSDAAADWKAGLNIGVFTGTEVSPGRFLADVDFDWPEGLALAKHILPTTGFGFGRASRPLSHAFYTTPAPIASMKFADLEGKTLVELRGTKIDGTIGMQTMMPGSIHPSGEEIQLKLSGEIGFSEELPRRVTLYAIGCLLLGQFGPKGFLHDQRLATAGFLLGESLTEEEVMTLGTALCEATGNSAVDFKTILGTTAAKIRNGDRVSGKTALVKLLGNDGRKTVGLIKQWLGSEDFTVSAKGTIIADSQDNVRLALEKLGVALSYDVFAQKSLIDHGGTTDSLTDATILDLWFEVDATFQFRPNKDFFFDVMSNTCTRNKFHPVLDYLRGVVWDGVPRIDTWLVASGGAIDSDYTRAVSSLVLLAAVHRITTPGCKFDEMMVLESAQQGLLKSTALRTLCPNENWFSDDLPLNVDAKQIVERTLGKWIIEASDLSGMMKSKIEHLKGMLSRQVDGPVRLAYGRMSVEVPRQYVIIGTTNSSSYLIDPTGNRRFWPVKVTRFNIQWIRENRDQLWAEAYSREQAGESIRLHPSLYPHAALQQAKRREEDAWEAVLNKQFSRSERQRLFVEDAWAAVGVHDAKDMTPDKHKRLLDSMKQVGFRRMSVRKGDIVNTGFGREVEKGQLDLDDSDDAGDGGEGAL